MNPPTIILLPGLDGTGELFKPLLSVIPANIPTKVVSYPPDQPLSYDQLLDLIETKFADAGPVLLVAESFSGPLALRFAARHQERGRGVVLCASFIRAPIPRWLAILARPMLFRLSPPAIIIRHWMVGPTASDELVRMVKDAIRLVKPRVLADRIKSVLSVDASRALAECPAPLLYIGGLHDRLVRQVSINAIRSIRPDIQLAMIDGPHLLAQRNPEAIWREIARIAGIGR